MKVRRHHLLSVLTILGALLLAVLAFGCGEDSVAGDSSGGDSLVGDSVGGDSVAGDDTSDLVVLGEVEATEFEGVELTPIDQQRNNALSGTQVLDMDTYTLIVDGLVDKPLSLSYADLEAYEQESWLMDLNCVEGWSFTAKWTGPKLSDILADAGVKSEALIAIFCTGDVPTGYTSLPLDYIIDNDIILALKLNDITLPHSRGFPFQVVAKSKYGYKWAKWVTRIELSSDGDFRGFWESGGYSNDAEVGGPAFD